jgi:hypothetical protein
MEPARQLAQTIYIEALGDRAVPLLPAGSALPAVRRHRFFTARDDQTAVETHLLFGASAKASENVSLARWELSGIPPLIAEQSGLWLQIEVGADGWVDVVAADRGEPLPVSLQTKAVVMAPVDPTGALPDALTAIRQRINSGDREEARSRLVDLLQSDPQNLAAWALMPVLLDDPAGQGDCYRHILRRDPGNRYATTMLEALARPWALAPEAPMPDVALIRGLLEEAGDRDLDEDTLQDLYGRGVVALADRAALVSTLVLTEVERRCLSVAVARSEPEVPDDLPEVLQIRMPVERPATPSRPTMPSPEEIIQMAGGPLPPEERHECPECGAIVARTDPKCPWCDAPLPGGGEA